MGENFTEGEMISTVSLWKETTWDKGSEQGEECKVQPYNLMGNKSLPFRRLKKTSTPYDAVQTPEQQQDFKGSRSPFELVKDHSVSARVKHLGCGNKEGD